MKTTFTLTLLALTIQAMVNGQTPGSQTLKIRIDICGANDPADQHRHSLNNTHVTEQQQTDELKNAEQELKEEIFAAQQKLLAKHIALSRIKSQLANETYGNNAITIDDLLKQSGITPLNLQKGEILAGEAAYAIKLAKEIREEADAQPTVQAQLAEMSNAEEKEALALAKQQEAIKLLKQAIPLFIKNTAEFAVQPTQQQQLTETPEANIYKELATQAKDIKATYEALRSSAIYKTGNEKAIVLNEALEMEQEYLFKQIEISLLRYQKTEKTFLENKRFIELLLTGIDNDVLTQKAQQLIADADYNFRLGKEMREEANAQPTTAARLAEMSNAEEKELLALNNQQQSLLELKKCGKSISLAVN